MGERATRRAAAVLLLLGALLRLSLWAVNPPDNAFDDHYQPIALIVATGRLPARDDCWECYHPPAFYLVSAGVAELASAAGLGLPAVHKLLQLLPCLYGVLTLGVCWLVLRRLELPALARLGALGVLCVLPRHVYMSAMHSNDTAAVLAVALSGWLLLVAVQTGFRTRTLCGLAITLALAVGTKYTALVVLPMTAVVFAACWWWRLAGRRRLVAALPAVLAPAALAIAAFALPNIERHGTPFPSNLELFHADYLQGREDVLDIAFFEFRPWAAIATPLLSPDNRSSLWTLITARMWFDMEPRFLPYVDAAAPGWWDAYRAFLGGPDSLWPGTRALSPWTLASGRVLIALGLLPLGLLLLGLGTTLYGRFSLVRPVERASAAALQMCPVLVAANVAGMALTCIKFPYSFSMKAVYVMTGLLAYVICLALGLAALEHRPRLRRACAAGLLLLGLAATAHIAHLVIVMAGRPPGPPP